MARLIRRHGRLINLDQPPGITNVSPDDLIQQAISARFEPGLLPAPVWPGPGRWSFERGGGLPAPSLLERVMVDSRNDALLTSPAGPGPAQAGRLQRAMLGSADEALYAAGIEPRPTGAGATPILARANQALYGAGVEAEPTGAGATPILARANQALYGAGVEAEATGAGATPILARAKAALGTPAIADPWAGSYTANPDRLATATIGGAEAVAGSGGPTTARPGVPAPAEQLGQALDISNSPALAAATQTALELNANPAADIRQLDPTVGGAPVTPEPIAAPSAADQAVRQQTRSRRQAHQDRLLQARQARIPQADPSQVSPSRAAQAAAGAMDAIGYVPADLGAGDWIARNSAKLAGKIPVKGPVSHSAAQALGVGGKFLGAGVKALPWIGAAAPAVLGAIEGSQSGAGGAAIQGGLAAAGTVAGGVIGSMLAPGLGTAIGAGIGGSLGSALGGAGRSAAVSAVEAAQGGDTGLAGQIGRSLDGMIDTPMEVEGRQAVAQMNSPAVLALKAETRQREAEQRAQMAQNLLMQAYARGLS